MTKLSIPMLALALSLGACASTPPSRPVALDPTNAAAPESPTLAQGSLAELGRSPAAVREAPPARAPLVAPEEAEDVESGEVAGQEAGAGHVHGARAAASGHAPAARAKARAKTEVRYSCPMHPEVVAQAAGRCPKCGMNLEAQKAGAHPGGR
jgi:heavy metal-binding protein